MKDRIADAVEKEKEIWRPLDKEEYHTVTTTNGNYEMILTYYRDYGKYFTG